MKSQSKDGIISTMQYEYAIGPELPGDQPEQFDCHDKFWLDVDAFSRVAKLISSTQLATFELAALSHESEHTAQRQQILDMIAPKDGPASAEQRLALNLGYVYGKLLAKRSNTSYQETTAAYRPEIVVDMFKDISDGLDLGDLDDNFNMFCRLRQKEIDFAGSDILGFGLAHVQDNLLQEIHRITPDSAEATLLDDHRLGTLFYAGALAGGLFHSDISRLSKATIELSRGYHALADGIRYRQEYKPSGEIAETVDHVLFMRNVLRYANDHENGEHIVMYPRFSQVGPRTVSSPIHWSFLDEYAKATKIPIGSVDKAVILNEFGRMEERAAKELNPESNIILIQTADGLCGSLEKRHPALEQILDSFVDSEHAVPYLDHLPIAKQVDKEQAAKITTAIRMLRLSRIAAGIFVATSVAGEVISQKTGTQGMGWVSTIATSAVALLSTTPVQYYRDSLRRNSKEAQVEDPIFQAYLDQLTMRP